MRPRGARAHDGHALPARGRGIRQLAEAAGALAVRHEALQPADLHGLVHAAQGLAKGAAGLALLFLGTDAPADRGKEVCPLDHPGRLREVTLADLHDEGRYVYAYGAAGHAGLVLAVEAARGLEACLRLRIAFRHLCHVAAAQRGILAGHVLDRETKPVPRTRRVAERRDPLEPGGRRPVEVLPHGCVAHERPPLPAVAARGGLPGGEPIGFHLEVALLVGLLLELLVGTEAVHHPRPVHLVAVEFRPVHADEPGLAAHGDAAAAAHARAVDHDRVEGYEGLHAEWPRGLGAEAHHDGRAYGHDDVGHRGLLAELLEWLGDEGLAAGRAVIRHHDVLVREGSHLVLHDEEVLGARPGDHREAVARGLEGLDYGMERRKADTAAPRRPPSRIPRCGSGSRGGRGGLSRLPAS